MRILTLFAAGFCAAAMSSASAQVLFLGSGLGKDCYDKVLLNSMPNEDDEQVCTRAIQSRTLNKRNLVATHINRGIMRMRMNNFDQSLEDYAVAKELSPDFGAVYLNEGAALVSMGRHDDAIDALNRAIELETQDVFAAYYNRALANEILGNDSKAYFDYRKALELRPGWDLPTRQLERFTVVTAES